MISDILQLFLDTNIWLSFYSLSKDDLEELRKLSVLIDHGRLKLYVTDQVRDEFRRNRENKFAAAMKRFTDGGLPDQFPQVCKDFVAEYEQMRAAIRSFKDARDRLLKKVSEDFENEALKADEIIQILFKKAIKIQATDEIVQKAQVRRSRGNPPGKGQGPIGDEINWECLLETIEEGTDFYVIAEDEDWRRSKDGDKLKPFLQWEWKRSKRSDIFYYRELTSFFRDKFPEIKLARELEKDIAIKKLASSSSFKETRVALRQLLKLSDFSISQMNEIVTASNRNNQVFLIGDDKDIVEFMGKLVDLKRTTLDAEVVETFFDYYFRKRDEEKGLVPPKPKAEGEDIPF
jgi:hypothetical protein